MSYTFPRNVGDPRAYFQAVAIQDLIALHLSPEEPAQQTERNTENMNTALVREAAQDILSATKEQPAKVKPTAPKLSEIRISTSANGFIVDGPKEMVIDPYAVFGFTSRPAKPVTFESLNSLVSWLRKNIARPDKEATK